MYNCNLKKNYIGFNSKGKAIIMKKLGRKGSACMMAIALCAMTVPVFAGSNNKSVKSAKYNAYSTEYVGFVEGPLTISDKVSYTFTLSGKQNNKLSMTYRAGTPNKRVAEGVLNATYGTSVSGTNVSAGSGNTYGYAAMDFEGSTYEIHATD